MSAHTHSVYDVDGAADRDHRHFDTERDVRDLQRMTLALRREVESLTDRVSDLERATVAGEKPEATP